VFVVVVLNMSVQSGYTPYVIHLKFKNNNKVSKKTKTERDHPYLDEV